MGMGPCCCCSSRTGSIVIGILELIGSIYFIYDVAVGIAKVDEEGVKAAAYVEIVAGILTLFLAIFLLIGIKKEIPSYLKLWIGVRSFVLVVRIILFIVAVCAGGVPAWFIAVYLISIALAFWFIYVVYHFMKQLENGETDNQGHPSNKA